MRTVMPRSQAGSSLIVAIVFLLLLSTLALAALRSSTTNVMIVGNMQARQEAQATAQMLLEKTVSTDEFARNGSMPMSMSRLIVLGASLAWVVVSSRCPLMTQYIASCTVSRSRISPTMITSGSWRMTERNARAKVRPVAGFT